MKILVTGAKGMVGTALVNNLKNIKDGKNKTRPGIQIDEIYEYDIDSTPADLDNYCRDCDFVFNLAGVNRPKDPEEFMKGNFGFYYAEFFYPGYTVRTLRRFRVRPQQEGRRGPVLLLW